MQRSVTSGVRSALVVGCFYFVVGSLVKKLLFEVSFSECQDEEQ